MCRSRHHVSARACLAACLYGPCAGGLIGLIGLIGRGSCAGRQMWTGYAQAGYSSGYTGMVRSPVPVTSRGRRGLSACTGQTCTGKARCINFAGNLGE